MRVERTEKPFEGKHMYILLPISIRIDGELKGNLDPDFKKVEKIRNLAGELGLNCELEIGTPQVEGIDGSALAFPEDAPAPEIRTIDEIEQVICILSIHNYRSSVQRDFIEVFGELDYEWMRDHLGYFSNLEPKYRDAIMASCNPLGPSRPARKDSAKTLGVSVSTMNSRVKEGFRLVVEAIEKKRKEYIDALTPETVIAESVAVLDYPLAWRLRIRQLGIKTVGELADLTYSQFLLKMQEERFPEDRVFYERALLRWGLRFKDEDPS